MDPGPGLNRDFKAHQHAEESEARVEAREGGHPGKTSN